MRKSIIFTIVCSALLMGGCGKVSTSSPPVTEQEDQQQEQKVDEKLAHRFEQRGFEVEGMMTSMSADEESSEEEAVQQQTSAEKMAKQGTWTMVDLVMNEDAKSLFNEQTVRYFEEDITENYPPPKKNTIDAVATVIYKNNDSFILDGLLRNGFHEQSFTLEQLKPLVFKLVTANNQPWILTTLGQVEGVNGLKGKEAVPFRLVIPKEKVKIPEFNHLQFSYHAVVEQPVIDKPKEKENAKKEEE